MLSFSTVKVRQYGGAHKVDIRSNHHDRWSPKKIQRGICKLWKDHAYDYRAFIFIGFDRASSPLRCEFLDLDRRLDWSSRGVANIRDSWPDSQQRQLSVIVSLWEINQRIT